TGHRRLLIPAGLMAGYAFAIKATGGVMLPFALAWVIFKSPMAKWRSAFLVASAAAVMMLPWLLKNWVVTGNPAAPFATRIFRTPYVHPVYEGDLLAAMSTYGVDRRVLPLEVMLRGGVTQGVIGPVFLIATVSLLALRLSAGRRLLAAAAVMLLPYFA